MPTLLPRFQVTETPEIARALKVAEQIWPELPRSERIKRLLVEGAEALHPEGSESARDRERLATLHASAGMFTDGYEADHLQRLHEEWPE
jgi:hypothetical protein